MDEDNPKATVVYDNCVIEYEYLGDSQYNITIVTGTSVIQASATGLAASVRLAQELLKNKL